MAVAGDMGHHCQTELTDVRLEPGMLHSYTAHQPKEAAQYTSMALKSDHAGLHNPRCPSSMSAPVQSPTSTGFKTGVAMLDGSAVAHTDPEPYRAVSMASDFGQPPLALLFVATFDGLQQVTGILQRKV